MSGSGTNVGQVMTSNATQSDGSSARGGWAWWLLRLVVLFVVFLALYAGGQFGRAALVKYAHTFPRGEVLLAANLVFAALMIIAYRLLVRWMEGRSADELGLRHAVRLSLGGTVVGMILFVGVYAALWFSAAVKFEGWESPDVLLVPFSAAIAAAVGEEIILRGVVYRYIEDGFGTAVAIIASGALFGLLHAANPGATFTSSAAIALEAGVLLAAAYSLARSLWLPIGIHFGWNFTEGGVFGASVSGGASQQSLLKLHFPGPDFLTGGSFGPEASLPAVTVSLVAAIVILVLAAHRGQWRPLRFRLRSA
jgi:CAAX protease family protein